MPTYEYECMECKNRFDVFQSINDNPVEKCVKCNGKVRKLFNTAGIIFKGSGFYVTDYKNNADGNYKNNANDNNKNNVNGKRKSGTDVKQESAPPCAAPDSSKPDCCSSES